MIKREGNESKFGLDIEPSDYSGAVNHNSLDYLSFNYFTLTLTCFGKLEYYYV